MGWFNKKGVKWEVVSGNIEQGDDLDLEIFSNVDSKKLGKYESWAISNNPNYEVIVQRGVVNVRVTDVQMLFFIIIGIMIVVAIIVGITILIRVKTRKRRLKKAAKYERQSLSTANKTH